jgi:hypothetical protein
MKPGRIAVAFFIGALVVTAAGQFQRSEAPPPSKQTDPRQAPRGACLMHLQRLYPGAAAVRFVSDWTAVENADGSYAVYAAITTSNGPRTPLCTVKPVPDGWQIVHIQ